MIESKFVQILGGKLRANLQKLWYVTRHIFTKMYLDQLMRFY